MKIYHNNLCSKSCTVLEIIRMAGIEPIIVNYLETPPSETELRVLLKGLRMSPEELMRKGEPEYAAHIAGKALTDDEQLALMVAHPVLIQRPIVVVGDRVVLGRPPEAVRQLLP